MNGPKPYSRWSPAKLARRATLAAAMLVVISVVPTAASARTESAIRASPGVTVVTGGISTDVVDHMRAIEKDFNLKMVFALNNGEYLADVKVQVIDPSNHVVIDTLTDGPWLLARLPAGSYQVHATYGSTMERRVVAVAPASLKTLDFRWPTE